MWSSTFIDELGHLTLEEYAEALERTLKSALQLPRRNGHFFKWYDIQTSRPLESRFISTVDSGNLAACLWTLKQSCLGLAGEPLFSKKLWRGMRVHIQLLSDLSQETSVPLEASSAIRELAAFAEPLKDDASSWIGALPTLEGQIQRIETRLSNRAGNSAEMGARLAPELTWWAGETAARLRGVRAQVENLIPWALPEYSPLIHSGCLASRGFYESAISALLKNLPMEILKSSGVGWHIIKG
jgi:cyclic beta-1,2-glucan synthetase